MTSRPAPAEPTLRRLRIFSAVALVTIGVIITVITMWPWPPAADGQSWLREYLRQAHANGLARWVTFGRIEFGSNILMFVPIGMFGAFALPRRRWLIVPAAMVASAGIETLQAMALPLRYATFRDVISNTLGALLGFLLATALVAYVHRRAGRQPELRPAPAPAYR
jgi:glycopeptide antibiotics resistance protein